jgi:hypothetical protein
MITINGSENLTMKGSGKVRINTAIKIYGTGTELPVTIQADFNNVPPHLHQLYMQSMVGSYGNVNVYDNTKDETKPPSNKNNMKKLKEFFSQIWLGFTLAEEYRSKSQWGKW